MSYCFATGLLDEPWSCHSHRRTPAAPADDTTLWWFLRTMPAFCNALMLQSDLSNHHVCSFQMLICLGRNSLRFEENTVKCFFLWSCGSGVLLFSYGHTSIHWQLCFGLSILQNIKFLMICETFLSTKSIHNIDWFSVHTQFVPLLIQYSTVKKSWAIPYFYFCFLLPCSQIFL